MNRNRRVSKLLALVLVLPVLPGCILAAVAVGAGVVAATSEDTAQVDLKAPPADVYQAAVKLVEDEGAVTSADEGNWNLTGEVESSKVTITIFRVNEYTRVQVKARKVGGTLPDLDLSKRIANDLSHEF